MIWCNRRLREITYRSGIKNQFDGTDDTSGVADDLRRLSWLKFKMGALYGSRS